jgi:hypothetical protein
VRVGSADSHFGGCLDLGDNFGGLFDGPTGNIELWFRNIVDCAQTESAQSCLRASFGERGNHDHGHGMAAHKLFEEGQAIHARHLDIEGQHIGMESLDFFPGSKGVTRGPDNFELRV